MRPSSLSVLRSGAEAGLPTEVERLLSEVVADGFVVYCCGPRAAPFALVSAYQWDDYVDPVTIRCFGRVTTAKVPAPHHGQVDVLTPEVVVWALDTRSVGDSVSAAREVVGSAWRSETVAAAGLRRAETRPMHQTTAPVEKC